MRAATPLTDRCQALLGAHGHVLDDAQRRVVGRLEDLRRRLLLRQSRRSSLLQVLRLAPAQQTPVRGLYLWGGVGRGKTLMVDQFFAELPLAEKRRDHFHRFMQEVHAGLARHRDLPSPLDRVAGDFAAGACVLCLDEFAVSDIADAMILGAWLDALFERNVTLVATSNQAPGNLYRDGLQRKRFLPAIAQIERQCRVLELDAGIDYRLRQLERALLFLGPEVPDAEARMAAEFESMADEPVVADANVGIDGRPLRTLRGAEGLVWFDFSELCGGPRSAADYIEIARCYHTVLLSRVPAMDGAADDPARRFIALVDEFYDRGVKLILSAAAPTPAGLYRGERLALEFRRTASRLHEMQSHEYLARPHRP